MAAFGVICTMSMALTAILQWAEEEEELANHELRTQGRRPKSVVTPTDEARKGLHRHFTRMPKPTVLTTTCDSEPRLSFVSSTAHLRVCIRRVERVGASCTRPSSL